jgi:hypothetical protein
MRSTWNDEFKAFAILERKRFDANPDPEVTSLIFVPPEDTRLFLPGLCATLLREHGRAEPASEKKDCCTDCGWSLKKSNERYVHGHPIFLHENPCSISKLCWRCDDQYILAAILDVIAICTLIDREEVLHQIGCYLL